MILHQVRKHLADEMRNFPLKPDAALQSYALTTAVLARKILDYLEVTDLTLPDGLGPRRIPPTQNLRKVLDHIIHFRMLGQDNVSFGYAPIPDLITLYSDKNLDGDHVYIRLADYRDMMNRLANDGLFVAQYLLRRTITLLSRLANEKVPRNHKDWANQEDHRRMSYQVLASTWNILCDLSAAGKVEIPSFPIDCYEYLFPEMTNKSPRFLTSREFFDGSLKVWQWARFNPPRIEIEGRKTYFMLVNKIEPKRNGPLRGFVIPFETLICLFETIRKQIGR